MGLLSQIGKLTRNEARALRASQLGGSTMGRKFGVIPEYMKPHLMRGANRATGGALPNIGNTGMSETETEIVRMLQRGMSKEQIAQSLYQGGVDPKFVEVMLNKAQQKLLSAGELF